MDIQYTPEWHQQYHSVFELYDYTTNAGNKYNTIFPANSNMERCTNRCVGGNQLSISISPHLRLK